MSDTLRWCLISGSLLILLIVVTSMVVWKKKSKEKSHEEFSGLLEALGGLSNISNVVLSGSRISLNFENKKSINKELIKDNGVDTIVFSNKKVTLVIGKKAPVVYKYLTENKKEV